MIRNFDTIYSNTLNTSFFFFVSKHFKSSYSVKGLVVGGQHLPTFLGHEAWWHRFTGLGSSSHSGSRNKIEVASVWSLGTWEELHLLRLLVVSGHLEWKDLHTVQHWLLVLQQLLAVPDVIQVTASLWVLNTSWISASDEVGQAATDSGRGVPQHFSWATVVHWGWPDGKHDVLLWQGAVINEGLMLKHAVEGWDIIILAPATKWVQQKDWVLVSFLHQLVTGILEQENVAIVEWVSDLEAVDSVSISLLHLLVDLTWGESVLVEAIVEFDALEEVG